MRTLVLWDIDGTLVLTGRAGLRALDRAVADVTGAHGVVDGVPVAGRTDRAIVCDVLAAAGHQATGPAVDEIRERYCTYLRDEVARDTPHWKGILPGVSAALDALVPLEAEDRVAVGLLTGNFARGAEIKLGYFNLWRRFRFGAFGDHHADRRDLVPLAIDAAARAGAPVAGPHAVIVVGDTPADVDCAHAHGARAVAVATGGYDVTALRATGADVVVPDLSDWSAVWRTLQLEG